jgi:TonB family protein
MSHLGPSLRRRRRPARHGWRLLLGLVASLLANGAVLLFVKVDLATLRLGTREVRPVALEPLSSEQWARNRAVEPGRAEPTPPAPKPPPRPSEPKGQVVDVAPTGKPEAPENARFLGERDNKVEKETRSRYARAGFERTLPVPTQPAPQMAPARPQPPTPGGAGQQGGEGAEARKPGAPGAPGKAQPPQRLAMARPEAEAPAAGGILPREQAPVPAPQPGPRGEGGEGGEGGTRPGRAGPLLAPSADFYDRLRGGPAPDHLEGVDVGEGTFLNTREWRYAGYFNRIKQSVSMTWDPNAAARSRDPTGERYLYRDRVTVLEVTLDEGGALTDAHVLKTSGVDFLDRAAVEAFQKAQPFVNPPRGLADGSGAIRFQFGFYLEVGSSGLRLFRAPAQ